MPDISTIRHQEVFDTSKHNPSITLVGAGAIGSRLFAKLVELGLTRITVYDPDTVESHNLANQLYASNHIGKPKVEALADWYTWKTSAQPPDTIRFCPEAVGPSTRLSGVVILAVDSFEARRAIVENNIRNSTDVFRFYDTRMASRHGHVMRVEHEKIDAWFETLGDDDKAEVSACGTSLSVGATAEIVASVCTWQLMLSYIDPTAADEIVNIYTHPWVTSTAKF